MDKNNKNCYIKRIKLLNFHNFSNVTIDVNNGGHLFILGDNGSGKTTVLDAIHYVLTAGEYMEFNAAARVTGNKQQGRRAQSIVTRYNVDTGHMRPAGGVSYAALEIINKNGKVTTAAIGLSVNSPNDSITRWGIIREGALEDVPFVITEIEDDIEQERPRDKAEMRTALGGQGYYGQPTSFCNQLAEKFLGGRYKFQDFCRFLGIGKAYREIAAHTSDYQALFMRLLPESDKEIFDRIIVSLKSIDESREHLIGLEEKLKYVRGLLKLLEDIENANCQAAMLDAGELFIRISNIEQNIAEEKSNIKKWKLESSAIEKLLLQLKGDKTKLESKISELKDRDASNALVKEKELRDKLELQTEQLTIAKKELDIQIEKVDGYEKQKKKIYKAMHDSLADLMIKLPEKSLKTGVETAIAAAAIERTVYAEEPLDDKLAEILLNLLEKSRELNSQKQFELNAREEQLKKLQEQETEILKDEEALLNANEAVPQLHSFEQLLTDFDNSGLVYTPIYKGLEWHPDLPSQTRSQLEEFFGEELLSIITVSEEEYDNAADIIFNDYQGHRLAVIKTILEADKEFRNWSHGIFDVEACNPFVLDILLKELSAKNIPEMTKWNDVDIVRFRSHKRSFIGHGARFIGADSREQEQKRKIKALRKDLNEIRRVIKETEKGYKDLKSRALILVKLVKLIDTGLESYNRGKNEADTCKLNLKHAKEIFDVKDKNHSQLVNEIQNDREHLNTLSKLIKENNLQSIKGEIDSLEIKLENKEKEIKTQNTNFTKLDIRCDDADKQIKKNEEYLSQQQIAYTEKLCVIENKYKVKSPDILVEKLLVQERLHVERDAAKKAAECRSNSSGKLAELRIGINEISGTEYGFSYDQENNILFTREGITASAKEESLNKNLGEQQGLISDKTTELFKRLIVDSMVKNLAEKVHNLEKMQRKINHLLKERSFGNNYYKIKIKPEQRYEHFVKLIKTFSHYSPEGMEQMEIFFDEYKNELLNTLPGQIPDILDYRNWFKYEMHVNSSGREGIVMDSRVKSLGSGGEQAVPNYLLVLTIAHFMFTGSKIKLNVLLFDEAFYGIDSQRRDQLMAFATDLGLQLFVASPDQDGVKEEIAFSTSLLVVKDPSYEVHLFPYEWERNIELDMFKTQLPQEIKFSEEL